MSKSKKIRNLGCCLTGFISLIKPLVNTDILAKGTNITINVLSSYSGRDKALIKAFEDNGVSSRS